MSPLWSSCSWKSVKMGIYYYWVDDVKSHYYQRKRTCFTPSKKFFSNLDGLVSERFKVSWRSSIHFDAVPRPLLLVARAALRHFASSFFLSFLLATFCLTWYTFNSTKTSQPAAHHGFDSHAADDRFDCSRTAQATCRWSFGVGRGRRRESARLSSAPRPL